VEELPRSTHAPPGRFAPWFVDSRQRISDHTSVHFCDACLILLISARSFVLSLLRQSSDTCCPGFLCFLPFFLSFLPRSRCYCRVDLRPNAHLHLALLALFAFALIGYFAFGFREAARRCGLRVALENGHDVLRWDELGRLLRLAADSVSLIGFGE
jgi:hypothetical protein